MQVDEQGVPCSGSWNIYLPGPICMNDCMSGDDLLPPPEPYPALTRLVPLGYLHVPLGCHLTLAHTTGLGFLPMAVSMKASRSF